LCDVDRKKAEHFGKWLRDQHNLQVNAGGLEVTVEAGVTDKQLNKHLRDQAFSYRLILGPMPPSATWLRRAVVATGSWKARTIPPFRGDRVPHFRAGRRLLHLARIQPRRWRSAATALARSRPIMVEGGDPSR